MSETDAERLNIVLAARDKELAAAIDRNTRRIEKFAGSAGKNLSGVSQKWDRMGASAKAATTAQAGFFNMSASGRFVLQNTTAQLGDMAVQWESGTAASRIAAQQLPQLLGGFGALGGALGIVAPLLGTVAAVGIPMAAMLALAGDDAETAGKKVKTFADKLGEAEAALARAEASLAMASEGGLDSLADRYGEITVKVRDLADALADIEVRATKTAIGVVLDEALGADFQAEVDKVFGTVGAALVNVGTDDAVAEAQQIRDLIAETEATVATIRMANQAVPQSMLDDLVLLREELAAVEGRVQDIGSLADEMLVDQATLEALAEMRNRLEAARAAGDFHGMAEAMSDIRATLEAAGDTIDQAVIDGLVQAEDQARQMALELGQAGEAAVELGEAAGDIAGGLSPAVSEAVRLAQWLEVSLATAQKLAAMGPQGVPGAPAGGRGGDTIGRVRLNASF